MLHSVLRQVDNAAVHVHYLHGDDLEPRHVRRLTGMVERLGGEISFIKVDDGLCRGLPTQGFTRTATWYKVFLPDLLPGVDRVLHIDCDTIAVDSLLPLWETDLDGSYVAAVTNILPPMYSDRWASLGLGQPASYFNAGVLLFNLRAMRRDGCTSAIVEYARSNAGDLVLRDQDALNAGLHNGRVELHPRWNAMNALWVYPEGDHLFGPSIARDARERPAIRHFEGPGDNKPWHLLCSRPHRRRYLHHRRRTPWPVVRRAGVTPANIPRWARRRGMRVLRAFRPE